MFIISISFRRLARGKGRFACERSRLLGGMSSSSSSILVGLESASGDGEEGDVRSRRTVHPDDEEFGRLREMTDFEELALVRDEKLGGIGGVVKEEPAFFNVTEIPFVEATGDGVYLLVTIRRTGMDTKMVQKRLAEVIGVHRDDVMFAGLKDRHATCTQMFSVFVKGLEDQKKSENVIEHVKSKILNDEGSPKLYIVGEIQRNKKKLKKGLLRGNAFRVLVTKLNLPLDEALEKANLIKDDLRGKGIPNYFGPQRLGKNSRGVLAGYRLLKAADEFIDTWNAEENGNEKEDAMNGNALNGKKRKRPRQADFAKFSRKVKRIKNHQTFVNKMSMNAFQSGIFNSILHERIRAGLFGKDIVGDFVMNECGGKYRLVGNETEFLTEEQRRDGFTFTCPMPGYDMKRELMDFEKNVIDRFPIKDEAYRVADIYAVFRPGKLCVDFMDMSISKVESARNYFLKELGGESEELKSSIVGTLEEDAEGLLFNFKLPKGSFATSVLREFTSCLDEDGEDV